MEGEDGKMFSNSSLPDNSFSARNASKRLAAGLRPDPLEERMRTSKSLSRSGGHGREHSALMYVIMFAQCIIQRQYCVASILCICIGAIPLWFKRSLIKCIHILSRPIGKETFHLTRRHKMSRSRQRLVSSRLDLCPQMYRSRLVSPLLE